MRLRMHGTPLGRRVLGSAALLAALAAIPMPAAAQPGGPSSGPAIRTETPFIVEYYYKAKWGFSDEFARLFRKNHLPVLKKQIESGRFLEVKAEKPRYHATEDGRWDFRVTIVFRSAAAAAEGSLEEEIKKQLFPDQETYRREEQRRFEILLAHWDLPLVAAPEMAP
jgi:hypothetical protein